MRLRWLGSTESGKYYFVQDYEPLFYPAGTLYALAEATYRLGFAGLVNTPGLEKIYAGYDNPSASFVPAVEVISADESKPSMRPGAPVQVVLYGRPETDRNGFELLAAASRRVKDRLGGARADHLRWRGLRSRGVQTRRHCGERRPVAVPRGSSRALQVL